METLQRDGCHSLAVTKVSFFVNILWHPSHGLIECILRNAFLILGTCLVLEQRFSGLFPVRHRG